MVTLAAAIEFVEQLPIDQQDLLVQIIRDRQIERRRDEIYQNYLASVAEEKSGNLTFTTDIEEMQKLQAELEASDRYEVSMTSNEIIFKKILPNVLTWEDLSQRMRQQVKIQNNHRYKKLVKLLKRLESLAGLKLHEASFRC